MEHVEVTIQGRGKEDRREIKMWEGGRNLCLGVYVDGAHRVVVVTAGVVWSTSVTWTKDKPSCGEVR